MRGATVSFLALRSFSLTVMSFAGFVGSSATPANAGTLTQLGGMNLNWYCGAKYPAGNRSYYTGGNSWSNMSWLTAYPVLQSNDARGWRCEQPSTTVSTGLYIPSWSYFRYSIDVNEVCRWQYGKPGAYAGLAANNAQGWRCYVWAGPGY